MTYTLHIANLSWSDGTITTLLALRFGLTQEQLKNRFDVEISQQTLSTIEMGKRKLDAEKELPAFAAIYGRAIDYFYESFDLPPTPFGTVACAPASP